MCLQAHVRIDLSEARRTSYTISKYRSQSSQFAFVIVCVHYLACGSPLLEVLLCHWYCSLEKRSSSYLGHSASADVDHASRYPSQLYAFPHHRNVPDHNFRLRHRGLLLIEDPLFNDQRYYPLLSPDLVRAPYYYVVILK